MGSSDDARTSDGGHAAPTAIVDRRASDHPQAYEVAGADALARHALGMRGSSLLLTFAFTAAVRLLAQPLEIVPTHPSGIYALGETVGWTITATAGTTVPVGGYAYTIKANNAVLVASGTFDPTHGPSKIETKGTAPEMLYLQIAGATADEKPMAAGAAVAPEQIRPVAPVPSDFDAFWAAKVKRLDQEPVNPVITAGESGRPEIEYATVRLNNYDGSHVYGQLAKPARPGKFPAVLVMQWAGGPYPLQKSWVEDRAAQGWLALNVEPHDVPGDLPQAYYDALPTMLKRYNSIYSDDRDRCYFLRMFLGDYRALEYLTSRPDWDGKILLVTGGSMGGMQSFAMAALFPQVTHLVVDVPAGADVLAPLHGRHESYPNWDLQNPKVAATAPYFDPVNFAPHIRATCLVSLGFLDNVSAPTGIWTVFNLIQGKKEAVPLVYAAHNHQSTPAQMKPYQDRAAEWFTALGRGEEPVLRSLSP